MTQRIFDVENEKDMADLWDILPDDVDVVKRGSLDDRYAEFYFNKTSDLIATSLTILNLFKINWHDKTEITRPIQEATEADLGKLCVFWNDDDSCYYGLLKRIAINKNEKTYCYRSGTFNHCRRLTKQDE